MSVLSDRRLRWLSVALVLVAVAAVGLLGVGALAVVSAVATAAAGESILLVLLRSALPFVLGVATLTVVGAALVAWLFVRAVRVAEVPRSDRLERVARVLERYVPWVASVNVADRVAPTVEDRREALKDRYAAGELTEREFERELERLLEDEDAATAWSATEFDDEFDRGFEAELRRDDDDDGGLAGEDATEDGDDAETERVDADVERDRR